MSADPPMIAGRAAPKNARRATAPAPRAIGLVRIGIGVVLLAAVAAAAARDWSGVRETLVGLPPGSIAAAGTLALGGLFASALTWRCLLGELGSGIDRRSAAKVYLVGQLGKYVPGSAWAFLLQMELGKRAGVPRSRTFSAGVVAVGVNVLTSLLIGLLAVSAVAAGSGWALAAIAVALPAGLVLVSPPLLTREINLLLRVLNRPPLERSITWRGVGIAGSWAFASWLAYGTALWVLAVETGADPARALPLCLGGVALAMTAGFVIVAAPSGVGVREAALVAILAPVLPPAPALALALLLRAAFTVADLVAAIAVSAIPTEAATPAVARN